MTRLPLALILVASVLGIGLATYEISLDCLARRGTFITFGNASGAVPASWYMKWGTGIACTERLLGSS